MVAALCSLGKVVTPEMNYQCSRDNRVINAAHSLSASLRRAGARPGRSESPLSALSRSSLAGLTFQIGLGRLGGECEFAALQRESVEAAESGPLLPRSSGRPVPGNFFGKASMPCNCERTTLDFQKRSFCYWCNVTFQSLCPYNREGAGRGTRTAR